MAAVATNTQGARFGGRALRQPKNGAAGQVMARMVGKLKLGALLGPLVLAAIVAAALVPHSSHTGPQEEPPAAPEPDRPPAVRAEPVPAVEPAPLDEPHLPGPPDRPTGYTREQHGWYAMDVPAGWTLQYLELALDGVDLSQIEALGGSVFHTYAEPQSLLDAVPTSMDVMAAPTPLTLEEYAAFQTEVVLTIGDLFGLDNQVLGPSPAMLGSHAGLMMEYRLDLGPAEPLTIGVVTAVVDGVGSEYISLCLAPHGEQTPLHAWASSPSCWMAGSQAGVSVGSRPRQGRG